jgi:hypothetical protein
MNRINQVMLSLSLALVSSCANPMSGLQFACDPDDPSTCISGYVCVKAEPGHKYKGVCKPAQEADVPRDSGGKDLYQSDPGFTRDAFEGVCVPSCSGKECGDDGCGGSCGSCPSGTSCEGYQCKPTCTDDCSPLGKKECISSTSFRTCGNYDSDPCLEWSEPSNCASGSTCWNGTCACAPDCTGKECGADGCGGSCGQCTGGKKCVQNACQCVLNDYQACCGNAVCWFDSCGNQGQKTADCPYGCSNGQCKTCTPNCVGKQCGDDGCGGSCGQCGPNEVCTSDGVCSTVSGGSEFQVNTWTTSDQFGPFITSLANGGFVVVWTSDGQDGSQWGVYGQRFDSNGNKVGSEFQVNTWTTSGQGGPSITSLSNGGYVVVWGSAGQDGSSDGVYGQRFDSNGNKVGSEFQVNTWTAGWQGTSFVTSLSDGGFVVVWESTGQDGSGFGLYGQRFDSNGNKVGSEFRVNTWTTGDQDIPSVTSFYNGGFVVVWHSYGQDGSGFGIYGQRFDSDGSKVGSEFQVNTWTTYDQAEPSITSLSNGGFVVVWGSGGQDGSGFGVYGQRFDSNGNKVGSEFQVNTWTANDQRPSRRYRSVTSLRDGGFVVVWQSNGQDGSGWGVYGQRFDSNGNKVSSEFQVNTWTTNDQSSPSITSLPDGGFVVVWQSNGQDGSGWGVYGRIFSQ